MEYNMSWFAPAGAAPYLLATDLNDVMLNNVLEAPMLSDTPRSVSLMAGGGGGGGGAGAGGGGGDQTAGHDMAATVPQEFVEWGYSEYSGYDVELKPDDMELDTEEDIMGGGGDGKRKTSHNAKKPKVHLDPKLKLKGPITYEKDVDPSLIPINRDGMARCEKCGAIGVRHAFYTRERRYCSLRCARSVEGLAAVSDSDPATPEAAPPESPASADSTCSLDGDSAASAGAVVPRQAPHSFSWDALMRVADFSAAPVPCFPHAPLAGIWDDVCVGLKVEIAGDASSPNVESACWVGTVLRVEGYRGLVRYEGVAPEESSGRWMDLCSDQVHPVGWCATQGRPLIPPAVVESRHSDWTQLLVKRLTGARTLPANFHHKVLRSLSGALREDQVVEVVDKNCISQVRAAAITQVIGRRLHIRYLDAPEDDGGFWCHEHSPLVHPVGWAISVGHRLSAPADYLERCQTGQFQPTDVTENWQPPLPAAQEGFAVGMRLEALDPLNVSSIGVATVQRVLGGGYLMVRLETMPVEPNEPGRDWFCYHASSPYIFPARFCETVGIPLTPPHGYADGVFSWDTYLAAEGATAAPAHLFQRPPLAHGFQPGQRLEAVDLMDPQLVCVATVAAVVGRLLRLHFTGWQEQFDQWVDAASPDIFPVGWCRMVGYKLEAPRAGEKAAAGKRAGRRRVGRRVVSRRARPAGRPPRQVPGGDTSDDSVAAAPAATAPAVPDLPAEAVEAANTVTEDTGGDGADDNIPPPETPPPSSAEKLIPRLLDSPGGAAPAPGELNPEAWSVADVGQFLRVNECTAYCDNFERAGVDGPRLLELTKHEVLELACWKVGPSLKIENLVQKLRARVAPAQARFMASFKKV
ncbi:MBT domain-containing protein 1-like [Amphibalanus amphitrite]|uniref:MBT domain-containing protein 1-like n=1 Tax=Amphibalanus amphitrite TaxID=1232801 RepID=UPI001C913223|nr:MBT domain-containing protein 1-like [Amphibalanus amphitrite]XP_043190508.1 MBT domain-containing protein 1-like [Amphibalanus amphitrite]XP_043201139.1 MBT domain-containing protein 1-like [Amphibalanus amphitrite]XP_043201140.1 MBT domain-containing protein 1-like [Amphibalanus amphitrite]